MKNTQEINLNEIPNIGIRAGIIAQQMPLFNFWANFPDKLTGEIDKLYTAFLYHKCDATVIEEQFNSFKHSLTDEP